MEIEYWIKLLIELLGFLVLSYFIFYKNYLKAVGNKLAELTFAEEIAKSEEKVKQEFRKELEPIKSELAKDNLEFQIRYSNLHQIRVKVLLDCYVKFQEFYSAMLIYTRLMHIVTDDQPEKLETREAERQKRVNDTYIDMNNFYFRKKVILDSSLCSLIETFISDYYKLGDEFGFSKQLLQMESSTAESRKDDLGKMRAISAAVLKQMPVRLEEIELQFRKILLVEE